MKKQNEKTSPWLDCYILDLKPISDDPQRLQVSTAGVVQYSVDKDILVDDHIAWVFKNEKDSS